MTQLYLRYRSVYSTVVEHALGRTEKRKNKKQEQKQQQTQYVRKRVLLCIITASKQEQEDKREEGKKNYQLYHMIVSIIVFDQTKGVFEDLGKTKSTSQEP